MRSTLDSPTQSVSEVEIWSIDRLVPYERNQRKNDSALERMCASIKEFGFKIPCLVSGNGEVVDGHLRLKSACNLGISEVPLILCDEWSAAQVKAFRLMVNRSVAWADWDDELLAQELKDIVDARYDIEQTGFDSKEIDDLLPTLNPEQEAELVPERPAIPVSKKEDLWLCGPHRVLCGNSTSTEDVSRVLGESKPFLMVTDPPYGVS